MITWKQYVRTQGQFSCMASPNIAGTNIIQFKTAGQVDAEFDGLTAPQLQQLVQAINAHLNPPAAPGGQAAAGGSGGQNPAAGAGGQNPVVV